jgi:putative ATP-binding cassette transporter
MALRENAGAMVTLFKLLWRCSPGLLIAAVAASLLEGGGNAWVMGMLNAAIHGSAGSTAAAFALLAFSTLALSGIGRSALARLCNQMTFQMTLRLAKRIISARLDALEDVGKSKLLASLVSDTQQSSQAAASLPLLMTNVMIVIGCLGYLAWLSPFTFLIVGAGIGLGLLGQIRFRDRAVRQMRSARVISEGALESYQTLADGAKELKLNAARRKAFLEETLEPSAASYRDTNTKATALQITGETFGRLAFLCVLGLVVYGQRSWIVESNEVVTGYLMTILYMMGPFRIVSTTLTGMVGVAVALERIRALEARLAQGAEVSDGPMAPSCARVHVQLRAIAHRYRGEKEDESFQLGPLDFELSAGEILFLVGGNGSGKTTLAKLLCGLYVPEQGTIAINGEEVGSDRLAWYREHFSTVFADYHLFEQLFGVSQDGLDARATAHLEALRLEDKVSVKEGRFSTRKLSQGQRKRLALLMCYLEDRPAVIFDEWAADQDPAFREVFYTQILPELRARGKAVLVISHDDRYFQLADRIVRLELGQIVGAPAQRTRPQPDRPAAT